MDILAVTIDGDIFHRAMHVHYLTAGSLVVWLAHLVSIPGCERQSLPFVGNERLGCCDTQHALARVAHISPYDVPALPVAIYRCRKRNA